MELTMTNEELLSARATLADLGNRTYSKATTAFLFAQIMDEVANKTKAFDTTKDKKLNVSELENVTANQLRSIREFLKEEE